MRKFTKLIALLLAIVMLVSTAVACNSDTPTDTTGSAANTIGPSDTTSSVDTTTSPDTSDETTDPVQTPEDPFDTPETITIKKDGSTLNYTITRPRMVAADSNEMKTVQELSTYFSEKLGVTPTLDTDKSRKEDSEKLEIIVGVTDHPETEALIPEMTYGSYIVRALGNKLIIVSFSEAGYTRAMKQIEKIFNRGYNKESNEITVNVENFNMSEVIGKQLAALPIYEGGMYLATYDAGRVFAATECDEVIITDTTASKYDKYLKKLEAEGYTQYTSNDIGNNKFAIYTNDSYTINVGYYSYEKSVRLLVESKGSLPIRAEDNNAEKVTDAQITMIAVGTEGSANGLSMLIRLEDGRFIVIDGCRGADSAHLIETIKLQSLKYSNGKPVVAAWIITHGHGDHADLLAGSWRTIKNNGITVEKILLNAIHESYTKEMGYGNGLPDKIMDEAAPAFGADVYKVHVGQSFCLSNCKMEVLYTHEALAPRAPGNDYNSTSVIIKMTFTDSETGEITTFLSTGDATGVAMDVARDIFGDYMKSDIITVNHHGYGSGSNGLLQEVYKVVSPALVLWPVGSGAYGNKNGASKVLRDTNFNPSFKEVYYSGDVGGRDVVVPLPYRVGNVLASPH